MKQFFRFLTLLLCTVMGSQLANAQWVAPTPTASPLSTTDSVFIYNVGQKKWLGRGEAWTTQLILTTNTEITTSANGLIRFQVISANDTLSDGAYRITSNKVGGAANSNGADRGDVCIWRNTTDGNMGNGVMGCFTDGRLTNTNEVGKGGWDITEVSTNTYKIAAPAGTEGVEDGMVLGYEDGHASNTQPTNGLYFDVYYDGNEANCQYQFVTPANFEAYKTQYAVYAKSEELKAQIDSAAAVGVDVTAAQAVYDNTSSTIDQLQAAIDALLDAISNSASWDHPQNVTAKYITNPTPTTNLEGYTYDVTPNAFDASNNNAEYWGNANQGGAIFSQTINNLPSGVYRMTLTALTRSNFDAKFFVNSDSVQIAQVPSSEVTTRGAANTWFNNGNGRNVIAFYTLNDNTPVTFGLRSSRQADYWTVWRGFELVTYGTDLESFQHLSESYAGNWEDNYQDATYSDVMYEAVQNAITANQTATTKEAAVEAFEQTKAALAALDLNIQLWQQLQDLYDDLDARNYDDFGGALQDVLDEADAMLSGNTANNDELQNMINSLNQAVQDAINNNMQKGDDITKGKIVNPTFSKGGNDEGEAGSYNEVSGEGWTVTDDTSNFPSGGTSGLVEAWGGNFTISQQVSLKAGAYSLSTVGYYRTTEDPDYNTAYAYWKEANGEDTGNNTVRAEIFGGANAAHLKNIFTAQLTADQVADLGTNGFAVVHYPAGNPTDSCYMPNQIGAAANLLKSETFRDAYTSTVKFIACGTDKPVTLGIRTQTALSTPWTVWDNFKLVFEGSEVGDMKPVLDETVARNQSLLNEPMNATVKNAFQTVVASAGSASSVDEIVAAETALENALPQVNASIAAYQKLQSAKNDLDAAIERYDSTASTAAKTAAAALQTEVAGILSSGSYADDQIDAKVEEVNTAIAKLRIPNTDGASMATPKDMTSVINNPTFNGTAGWTVSGASAQNNIGEIWNKDGSAIQTIYNLPQGLYQVVAQGIYRYGGVANAASTQIYVDSVLAAGGTTDTLKVNGYLYANGDSVGLKNLYYDVLNDQVNRAIIISSNGFDGKDDWGQYSPYNNEEGLTFFIPNQRTTLNLWFTTLNEAEGTDVNHDGETDKKFLNTLYTYVGPDGVLRLGFFNHSHLYQDWTCATNFQLFYFGDGDDTKDIANTTGISDVNNNVVNGVNTFFTVDGRQVNSLQRGINIVKTTDAAGKTSVRKVVVK